MSRVYRIAAISFLIFILALSAGCSGSQSGAVTPTPMGFQSIPATLVPTEPSSGLPLEGSNATSAVGTPITDGASTVQTPVAVTAPSAIPVTGTGNFADAVRQVAETVKPAIVQITNQQTQVDQFNQPFTVPAGVGSGVIYDNQGHILTNNHVIAGAQKLLVSLPDGRSFAANLIGADPQTDLAVVQISGQQLPVARLGDSNALHVGDWVVAIGNALALPGGPTVSAGVVSALGRSVQEPADQNGNPGPFLFDLIQTDAPINPGNSGGALCNLAGEVIGINTLVAGQADPGVQAQGIGFAISIEIARPIADEIVSTGHVTHAYLGIQYQPLNPAIAAQLGIQQTQGALVGGVVRGSPADQADIQPDDVITAIDNQPLKEESDLAKFLSVHKPGDTVTLTVVRGSQTGNLQVKLAAMPSQ